MNILCILGFHRYLPRKVFWSEIIHPITREFLHLGTSYTGLVCKCGKRKIQKTANLASINEEQEAYNWLNEVPSVSRNNVLRLVKK